MVNYITMLYETFNSIRESFVIDYFSSQVSDELVQNLNTKFELCEYQKDKSKFKDSSNLSSYNISLLDTLYNEFLFL